MDIVIIWSPIVEENKMYLLAQVLSNHLFLSLHPQASGRMSPIDCSLSSRIQWYVTSMMETDQNKHPASLVAPSPVIANL